MPVLATLDRQPLGAGRMFLQLLQKTVRQNRGVGGGDEYHKRPSLALAYISCVRLYTAPIFYALLFIVRYA